MRSIRTLTVIAAATGAGLVSALVAGATAAPTAAADSSALRAAAARAALADFRVGAPAQIASHHHKSGATTSLGSYNWSGWANDNSTALTYKYVGASWKQPAVKCTKEDQVAVFWVGLDGLNTGTVEQDGTFAQCFQGVAFYYTWWEMYPTNFIQIVGTAHAGDKIASSVSFASPNYTLKVTDATTPAASFTVSQKCSATLICSNASAEWIAERPSTFTGLYPLANFVAWKVSKAAVTSNTGPGVISTFPNDQIAMIDTTATYNLATAGALGLGGNNFTDTWNNSY